MLPFVAITALSAALPRPCPAPPDSIQLYEPALWYETYWEPCGHLCCIQERIGRAGDGGKWICMDSALNGTEVISVGSNNDFSFESDLLVRSNPFEIHVYDHTSDPPRPPIAGVHFYREMATASSLLRAVRRLVATRRRLSILKIDCEGCEHEVFSFSSPDASSLMALLRREKTIIAVEVHFPSPKWGVFRSDYSKGARAMHRLWQFFALHSYYAYHKEPNMPKRARQTTCVEYALMPR